MKQQISAKTISIVFGVLVVCFAVGSYIYGAWTEPTTIPPGDNVDAPVNVGTISQTKAGALGVSGLFRAWGGAVGASDGLTVVSGNVGIGTTGPGASLDIGGNPNNAIRHAYLNLSANNTPITDRPYFRGRSNSLVIVPGGTGVAGDKILYLSYPGDITAGTISTRIQETLYISSTGSGGGGNVGIGTTSPTAKLHIGGVAGTDGIKFPDGTLQTTAQRFGNYGSVTTKSTAVPTTDWTDEFAVVQATTDLLLIATCAQTTDGWDVVSFRGYTGTTSNPTTYRAGMGITDDWGPPYTGSDSFTMFVKKGEYYVVKGRAHMDVGTTRTYSTIPVGN